jgi:hypothetical protein
MSKKVKTPTAANLQFATTTVQQLDALSTKRKQWEQSDFKKANDGLYALLSECLAVFQTKFVHASVEDQHALRSELQNKLTAAGVKVQKNTNTLNMFVRFVFGSDRKRAHGYAYVLTAAVSHNKTAAEMPGWIANQGGIEEIKRKMVQKPASIKRQQAIATAKGNVQSEMELATIAPLANVEISGLHGQYAILLAKPSADGHASIIGTLSDVDQALINALLIRMAKNRMLREEENTQLGKEKKDLMGASATNHSEYRTAA